MATKIRLMRLGKMRSPHYRVVVVDSRTKRDGRSIETIGKYHPKEEPSFIEIDSERALHWLRVGAQPSEAVEALLKVTGAWQEFKGLPAPPPMRVKAEKADKKAVFAEASRAAMSDEPVDKPAGGKKARKVDAAAEGSTPTADQMAADAAAAGQTLGEARDEAAAEKDAAADAAASNAAPAAAAESVDEAGGAGGNAGTTDADTGATEASTDGTDGATPDAGTAGA